MVGSVLSLKLPAFHCNFACQPVSMCNEVGIVQYMNGIGYGQGSDIIHLGARSLTTLLVL